MGMREHVSLSLVLIFLLLGCNGFTYVNSQRVPALFAFGDSLVDVGNNNFLNSIVKANFFPYGIDYARGYTGRFSNGRSLIDFIGDMLGVPSPPPFADPATVGPRILNGVNYASASGGILDDSGQHYGERYSLSQQVLNFEKTLSQYRSMMNATALNQFLSKSIAIMVIGNNDYISNYLLVELYDTSNQYSAQDFGNLLVNTYVRQILALYSLGLKKFFLSGIGPLGCIPSQRAIAPPDRCMDTVNQMVGFFNEGLKSAVEQLNKNHPDAIFVYGNNYGVFGDILNNPSAYLFNVVDRSCCATGGNQAQISCLSSQWPCPYRDQYMFWDSFNPTQSAVYVFAWRAVNGPPNDAYPINIKQLALM